MADKPIESCPVCQSPILSPGSILLRTDNEVLSCLDHFREKKQEYFVCLSLDSGNRLIARRVVTIGLLDTALVHPREVFAGPITDRAASIIIAHNHPSGDPNPSKCDIDTTQQIAAAGILLGIPLKDHIIIADTGHYSFKLECLL